jgi:hypothetical protein
VSVASEPGTPRPAPPGGTERRGEAAAIAPALIAPCGMNCALCLGYQRTRNHCPGCRGDDSAKMPSCLRCIIKSCAVLNESKSGFCLDCPRYPCRRLRQLDKRYRTKYGMSMLENLAFIKERGLDAFLRHEATRWRCPSCGQLLCVHRRVCLYCGVNRPESPTP